MSRLKVSITGRATRYECEDLDAGVVMHAHKPGGGQEHDIHCVQGAVIVYLHPDEFHVVRAGETLKPDTSRWHGLVPLEAGTVFVNTCGAENEAFESVLDSPHQAPYWVLKLRDELIDYQPTNH